MKNGSSHQYITCNETASGEVWTQSTLRLTLANCPSLSFICVDEGEQDHIQEKINTMGLQNQVQVNSYCSFTPGGTFYTINGNTKLDENNNGCDAADAVIPNFKFSITNGTNTGEIISNDSGNYFIPVTSGTQTITPSFENPAYFNVSPSNVSVTFPGGTSPFGQNFCVTPNGVHNDLEIAIVPVDAARPGFNSTYKIIYKNKGNQTQSGSISLAFNDAVLDFVNANPAAASQVSNTLSWDYVNLAPLESREISLTTNTNSPMEVPPVNGGDILNFTASVNSSLTDETPGDNTFNLNQTVVNSFDPNDKTCLEGSTITPEMVGKDVHYMIRFENTGTADAVNVVVKDMIDTTKFDINSLIPIDGSHPFVTRIDNTNKVEFIFENINLPFDDANNDGYVAFKIKTIPTLVLGDSFSNTASIYFDYNFPIITDPAVTTVAVLAKSDFEFENYFSIYPNPANDVLNIETKQTIAVTSINIYNTLGQVVLVIPNAQQTKSVDVSSLKTGNYLMKVNSDKGSSSVKFVKL
ncbi:MAG: T9SS type A sorting domain-containing protein [Flavobacterium sp.]|nr:T9SS type A sorting domain-containing protein [Flavobacterium sp.]